LADDVLSRKLRAQMLLLLLLLLLDVRPHHPY
jgi:hypothetical protein